MPTEDSKGLDLPGSVKSVDGVLDSLKRVARELYKKNLQLNIEHQRLEDILLQVAEAIFAVDENYKITLFNSSAEQLFGVRKEVVLGKSPNTFIKLVQEDTHEKLNIQDYAFKNSKNLKKVNLERLVLDSKNVSKTYLKLKYKNIVYEKGSKECVVALSDITDEVQIDKQKDEFISVASHELKTPISIVKTNLWMFNHISKGTINKKQEHFITEMEKGLVRLSKIVNNLLDISRIEQGRFVLEESLANVDNLIADSLDYFEEMVEKRGLMLVPPKNKVGEWVLDKERTAEALDNYISNAIKYTDKGGIKVETKTTNEYLRISVTDTGAGISQKDQKRLFKKFSRAKEGLKQETPGASTGLGLYITKKIIEEMGGEVGVISKLGKGSTFWFKIPKQEPTPVVKKSANLNTSAKVEQIKQQVKKQQNK